MMKRSEHKSGRVVLLGISEILAVLITIAVVIGAFIGVASFLSSYMRRANPNTCHVFFSLTDASLTGNTLFLHGVLTSACAENLRIYSVTIYKDNIVQYTSSRAYLPPVLKQDTYELSIYLYGVTNVSPGDTLTVVLKWVSDSGVSGTAVGVQTVS